MPIKSYLIYPQEGQKEALIKRLNSYQECEVTPAENQDILVAVFDTKDKQAEDKLMDEINQLEQLKMLSMVAGFNDEIINRTQKKI